MDIDSSEVQFQEFVHFSGQMFEHFDVNLIDDVNGGNFTFKFLLKI